MRKNLYLIFETIVVLFLAGWLAVYVGRHLEGWLFWVLYVPLLIFQGLWFYRIYIVGHEASHKKLVPGNERWNDIAGGVVLLPILTPINIYRKIHYFHHGFNRKDEHTSAMDTFVVKGKFKSLKTIYYYVIWYLSVFFGGFFLHSLISVLLFLFCPPALAVKVSPAFKGWSMRDQFKSIILFAIGILLHVSVYIIFGRDVYLYALGYPMLSFAWLLSLMVYIFHYNTTMGDHVRYNVRAVKHIPFISWILMNFNEHATHHQYPNVPWYDLPKHHAELPEPFNKQNQTTHHLIIAILQQLKGPHVVYQS